MTTDGSAAGNIIVIQLSLRRSSDLTLVADDNFVISDVGNNTSIRHVFNIPYTFVGGELDPYVTDGVELYLEKSSLSTDNADITVESTDFRLVRNV